MVPAVNDYKNITTATTTQVFTGACILAGITINATSAGSIQVFDGISGNTNAIGTLKASILEGDYYSSPTGIRCALGIRIVTNGASDITVVYRAA